MTDYFDTLAGRAGTTPLSPPLRPPQPDKAVQGKELYAHATTVLGPTRGVNPLPNLEAIVYPLATYNYLDRIIVLESKRSGLMQVHDQGHRDGAAALPVFLCILVLPREEGRGGSVPPPFWDRLGRDLQGEDSFDGLTRLGVLTGGWKRSFRPVDFNLLIKSNRYGIRFLQ